MYRIPNKMWLLFAILSAVFAAATAILAKIGIEGVDSNLATAIRTAVVLLMAWMVVFITHGQTRLSSISPAAGSSSSFQDWPQEPPGSVISTPSSTGMSPKSSRSTNAA